MNDFTLNYLAGLHAGISQKAAAVDLEQLKEMGLNALNSTKEFVEDNPLAVAGGVGGAALGGIGGALTGGGGKARTALGALIGGAGGAGAGYMADTNNDLEEGIKGLSQEHANQVQQNTQLRNALEQAQQTIRYLAARAGGAENPEQFLNPKTGAVDMEQIKALLASARDQGGEYLDMARDYLPDEYENPALGAAGGMAIGGLTGLAAPGRDEEGRPKSRLASGFRRGMVGALLGAGAGTGYDAYKGQGAFAGGEYEPMGSPAPGVTTGPGQYNNLPPDPFKNMADLPSDGSAMPNA